MELSLIQKIIVWAVPVVFAITVHEVAHGWVANRLGDPTARMLGRLTLNPIKHIDPVGTIVVPLLLLLLPGGFIFGWAKPVPVTQQNLRNQRRDMAIVAAAGPLSNILMALFWGSVAMLGTHVDLGSVGQPLRLMGEAGILINIALAVLNLLPLPPLDGGRVVSNLLPPRLSARYDRVEPYGFIILVGLMVTGILWYIMGPPYILLLTLFYNGFGIQPNLLF